MKPPPPALLPHDGRPEAGTAIERVSGPSFPATVKVLATALVLALLVYGSRALAGSSPTRVADMALGDWALLSVLGTVIAVGYWGILSGRTRIDGEFITQSGPWHKQVRIADITQLKLVSVPGLNGLVVPRLVVRTRSGLTTFHAGDPAVFARFRQLAHGR